jgi:protein-disulfide isomerase
MNEERAEMSDSPGRDEAATAPAADESSAPAPSGGRSAWQLPHWGWGVGGLGLGAAAASLAFTLTASPAAPGAPADRAQMQALVKETIMANPEIIPEAINALQEREVEKLLASNRAVIEKPFAGAWAGAKDGDVTLVEFFDFNCPFCRQSSADVERLLSEDPKLRIVFRDMPVLGPDSERFAMASLSAAQQGRYVKFYRTVFQGQGALTQERLIRSVRGAGLNEGRVANDLSSKAIREELEKNVELGRALGLTGTPSYVIGNQILSGAVGYDALKQAVADARKAQSTST